MPPGINATSTSLDLVGPGYPNYGVKFAGNFLHLLENFASPSAPENFIEGQLWYDTSDSNNKVLKIMNGSTSSARWVPASGMYQQPTDPRNSANLSLKAGDIWVDTSTQQLSIYRDNSWVLIGPNLLLMNNNGNTGIEFSDVIDATSGVLNSIIKYYIEGVVIAIFANNTVTPNPAIDVFTTLMPGINLNPRISNPLRFNGTASSASALQIEDSIFSSSSFLRKDDATRPGQIITGNIVFQQIDTDVNGGLGAYGLVINSKSSNFIQLYTGANDGILCNSTPGAKLIFKTKGIQDINLTSTIEISKVLINMNTNTSVVGNLSITNAVSLGSTISTGTVLIPNSSACDIGSVQNSFRRIYASEIGSTDSVIYGIPANGGYFLPGMIIVWAGITAPPGWLVCNGASYNKSDYPALADIFNTEPLNVQFAVPNVSTTGLTYIIKTDYAI